MKFAILLFTAIIFTCLQYSISFSQSSWVRQDSVEESCSSVHFVNSQTGFYVGNPSYVHKTTNGGQNWFILSSSPFKGYRQILCVNENVIFALVNINELVKSTNSGISWSIIYVYTSSCGLYGMDMYDANTGYITGSTGSGSNNNALILKTTNGGLNWITSNFTPGVTMSFSIECVNKDTTFNCGYRVWKSLSAGAFWDQVPFSIYYQFDLKSVKFVNNSTGFLAGKVYKVTGIPATFPAIYKTTSGGDNWIMRDMRGPDPGDQFMSMDFYNNYNGMVVSDSGCVYRTTNTGLTWIKQKNFWTRLKGVHFQNNNDAYIALINGSIYATKTGGWDIPSAPVLVKPAIDTAHISTTPQMLWQKVEYNAAQYSLQIALDSNFNNIVLNNGNIDTIEYIVPQGILSVNNTYYWRVRAHNPVYQSTWSQFRMFNTNTPLSPYLVSPLNGDTSVIASQPLDWSDVPSSLSYNIQISKDSVFFQTLVDTIYNINSNMSIPTIKLYGNTEYFWRVKAINVNGGGPWSETWSFKSSDCPTLITPQDNDTGIVYNTLFDWSYKEGYITYTTYISEDSLFNIVNFGRNDYVSYFNLRYNMTPGKYYYWIVNGRDNLNVRSFWSEVRKFKTSGLYTGIEKLNETPLEYKLHNNYPNPFNPSTVVRFSLPVVSQVSLKVYDVMGREVQTLVKERMQAGSYEVKFDGSNLNSGVYFYRIVTDEFSDTRRMLLLK